MHRHAIRAAALALTVSGLGVACSAQQPPAPAQPGASAPTAADRSSCTGAVYHFTTATKTTVLAFLSPPHTITKGGTVLPEDLVPVQPVTSAAASSAGAQDADRAYTAFVQQTGRDDAPPLGTAMRPAMSQTVSPSTAGTYALYRAADVITAQFTRTCGPGRPGTAYAYGTVTTWVVPRDGLVQCGTTDAIPPHAALARTLACAGEQQAPPH
jgi:hypothetical protein